MRTFYRSIIILSLLTWFVSCDFVLSPKIYVSEIIRNEGSQQYLPLNVKLQVVSNEKCVQETENIKGLLQNYFYNSRDFVCRDEEMHSWMYFKSNIAVSRSGKPNIASSSSELLKISLRDFNEWVTLALDINQSALGDINRYLSDKYFQKIEVKNLRIDFTIENNLDKEVDIEAAAVYWNNEPTPIARRESLKPEQVLELKLSDVLRDHVYDKPEFAILKIKKPKDKYTVVKVYKTPAIKKEPEKKENGPVSE